MQWHFKSQDSARKLTAAVFVYTRNLETKGLAAWVVQYSWAKRKAHMLAAAIGFRCVCRVFADTIVCGLFKPGADFAYERVAASCTTPRLAVQTTHIIFLIHPCRREHLKRRALVGWRHAAAYLGPLRRRVQALTERVSDRTRGPCCLKGSLQALHFQELLD